MTAPVGTSTDIDHLRSWIGREENASELLTQEVVNRFHASLDLRGPVPQAGQAVPQLIHFCLTQPAVSSSQLSEDGHLKRGGFLPPAPLPRRMWAGGSVTFGGDINVGDEVQRTSRIIDVVVKEGRKGPLCLVTIEHALSVEGRPIVGERQDIVYRGAEMGSRAETAPAAAGHHWRVIEASPLLLFRYSALTFNSHRIHYDRRYATEMEGYPGLVVHGPLQATMLIHFARELHGRPPRRFAFRSVSPIFDTDNFTINADEDDGRLRLWSAQVNGPVSMEATAEW